MKSGFVSLIGRPNVGKSTLLNAIVGKKIAITSATAQTTRNMIQGIYHGEDLQIIFVDTPGIHKPQNKLGRVLNKQAYYSINDVDAVLFLTDVTQKIGSGDQFIMNKLKETNVPVILVLNKIDKIPYSEILPKISEYKDLYPFKEIVPISAYKKKNIDELIQVIANYLTDDIKYFDDDTITNVSLAFSISELIREKVLYFTKDEVPHSVTCVVDDISEDKNNISIAASVIVDRENLKKILVGKNGSMIKKIGIDARRDIEELLHKRVYLDLRVKVVDRWRDKDNFLNQMGYSDFKE
jgi:GTP-binding protein Era